MCLLGTGYGAPSNSCILYLHANLIEHKASRMVEEAISFPTKLNSILLYLMQHWDKGDMEEREVRVGLKPESA